MHSLPYKKLIEILKIKGFVLARKKGSHMIFKHSLSGTMVSVPLHGKNKPIHIGTFLAILKQAGIGKDEM